MHKAYTEYNVYSLRLMLSVKFALIFLLTIGSAELGMSVGAMVLAQSLCKICSLAVTAVCKMCCVIASGVIFERSSYGV